MDALVMGLSRDVLRRKSSTGWRMDLAWEGRYQPLMQLKVLKLKTQKPTIFTLAFIQLLNGPGDAELCSLSPCSSGLCSTKYPTSPCRTRQA